MNDRIENGVIKKYYQRNKTLIYAAFGVLQSDHIYILKLECLTVSSMSYKPSINEWLESINF